MTKHLRRFGAAYILFAMFLVTWIGQAAAMQPTIREEGWSEFWAATFENWQSEWAQIFVGLVLTTALARKVWRVAVEQLDRIEARLERIEVTLDTERGER